MKLKFRLDPALKNAFLNIGTYFKKSVILKYLLVKPLSFLFKNFRRFYYFFSFILHSRIFKVFRFGFKIFAIINVILGFGVILSYNDLNLQEPIVILSIIYAKILDFFNYNLLDFFRNRLSYILRKAVDKIDHVEPSLPKTDTSARARWENKPKTIPEQFKSLRPEYMKYKYIDYSTPWYYSPYFYVPVIIVCSSLTIYFCSDSITNYWDKCTTYLVTSGLYTWFNNHVTLPANPLTKIWNWFTGGNGNPPANPGNSGINTPDIELLDVRKAPKNIDNIRKYFPRIGNDSFKLSDQNRLNLEEMEKYFDKPGKEVKLVNSSSVGNSTDWSSMPSTPVASSSKLPFYSKELESVNRVVSGIWDTDSDSSSSGNVTPQPSFYPKAKKD